MSAPEFVLTRTIVRFVRGGEVVREVVFEPGEPFTLVKLTPEEKEAYIVHLISTGRYEEVEKELSLPPYLRIVLPKGGVSDEPSRIALISVVRQAMDPEFRKSALVRYLHSRREDIVEEAGKRGVPRGVAEHLLNRFIDEIRALGSLEEVVEYERKDPVDYVVSLARLVTSTVAR